MTLKFNSKIITIGLLVLLAAMLILLNGCTTVRRSQTRLFKVERDHPELLAKYCAEEFPIRIDSIVTRDTLRSRDTIKGKTVFVDCDSVIEANKAKPQVIYMPGKPGTNTVVVDCPESYTERETINETKEVSKENTAALQVEKNAHALTKGEADKYKGRATSYLNWLIAAGVIIGLLIIVIYFLFKRQYKPTTAKEV